MALFFFKQYNGISVFHDRFWLTSDDLQLHTDSAGGIGMGFGIFFQHHWCNDKWPIGWHKQGITKDITVLELFPILVALFLFQDELKNKKIQFFCDNEAVVHILNTQTSKNENVMSLMRVLTLQCLRINAVVKGVHVRGIDNKICDALSRFQFSRFRELAPDADTEPYKMPDRLWTILDTDLSNWLEPL